MIKRWLFYVRRPQLPLGMAHQATKKETLEKKEDVLLFRAGAFSFSLKSLIIWGGKVFPRSQMSTNFLIFSYSEEQSNT